MTRKLKHISTRTINRLHARALKRASRQPPAQGVPVQSEPSANQLTAEIIRQRDEIAQLRVALTVASVLVKRATQTYISDQEWASVNGAMLRTRKEGNSIAVWLVRPGPHGESDAKRIELQPDEAPATVQRLAESARRLPRLGPAAAYRLAAWMYNSLYGDDECTFDTGDEAAYSDGMHALAAPLAGAIASLPDLKPDWNALGLEKELEGKLRAWIDEPLTGNLQADALHLAIQFGWLKTSQPEETT